MDFGNFFDAGNDILNAVQDAVETADFSGLKDSITDSVKKAMGQPPGGNRKKKESPKKNYFLVTRPQKNQGSFRYILGKVGSCGNIGLGVLSLIVSLTLAGIGTGAMAGGLVLTGIFAAAAAGFHGMSRKGKRENELVGDYYRYGEIIGPGREYYAIEDLARKAGETKDEVVRNITQMKKEGMLPYAMLDDKNTTLMLTDNVFLQYKKAEMAFKERREEERKENLRNGARQEAEASEAEAENSVKRAEEAEIQRILSEGSVYIRKIREVNDLIPDSEEMSDKLYRLENIVKRIFEEVREHPEKAKSIRKLMSYYLPTTDKLLDAYVGMLKQNPPTESVRKSKKEIEDSMDVITQGYEQLFDSLFQEEAWDISSDISVMKTMMAQDGLTKDALKKQQKKDEENKKSSDDNTAKTSGEDKSGDVGPSGLFFG